LGLDDRLRMIVCSCNRLTESAIRACAARAGGAVRVMDVYGMLGCRAQCGRCARTIADILSGKTPVVCPCRPEECKCGRSAA
jgi:bacterioferritin-associated ferredoxin